MADSTRHTILDAVHAALQDLREQGLIASVVEDADKVLNFEDLPDAEMPAVFFADGESEVENFTAYQASEPDMRDGMTVDVSIYMRDLGGDLRRQRGDVPREVNKKLTNDSTIKASALWCEMISQSPFAETGTEYGVVEQRYAVPFTYNHASGG